MDRHAALAMTYMVDYVTARRLHANVAVQSHEAESIKSEQWIPTLCS